MIYYFIPITPVVICNLNRYHPHKYIPSAFLTSFYQTWILSQTSWWSNFHLKYYCTSVSPCPVDCCTYPECRISNRSIFLGHTRPCEPRADISHPRRAGCRSCASPFAHMGCRTVACVSLAVRAERSGGTSASHRCRSGSQGDHAWDWD